MHAIAATVVGLLALGAGASSAHAAPVTVGPGPLLYRDGKLHVRLSCPKGTCRGSLRVDRPTVRFRLREGGRKTIVLRVAAADPGRRVTLRLREGRRIRRLHRSVRRPAVDRAWCGYSRSSEVLAENDTARLLRVPRTGAGDSLITVCRQGRRLPLSSESGDEYSSEDATVPTLTADWAAVATRSQDHYGTAYLAIEARSLHPPFERRSTYLGVSYGGSRPVPDRLSIAPDGALLLGWPTARTPTSYDVCAIDGRGDRLLDRAAGVDPLSLGLTGQIAGWTRDGAAQTATLEGPAPDDGKQRFGSSRGVC